MPQIYPADTQELQDYYNSTEFKKLIGKMFPGLNNKN